MRVLRRRRGDGDGAEAEAGRMRLDTAPEESRRIEREGCVRGNVGSERTHGGRRPWRSRDRRTRETVTLGLCGGFSLFPAVT